MGALGAKGKRSGAHAQGQAVILLLDTSVLIDLLNGRKERRLLLAELLAQNNTLATTAINVAEIHAGMRDEEAARTSSLLADLRCYPATCAIAMRAGQLRRDWARRGRTLELPDLLIAATAMEYDLTLLTDNRKDFPMAELKLHPLG
ncbi:MAG: PIN domain-containing protein [Acidobacteriaceae bacterium]